MHNASDRSDPLSHALVIGEWRMTSAMLGRGVIMLLLLAPLAFLLYIAWTDPMPGPRVLVLILSALCGIPVMRLGVNPFVFARSVWRSADGSLVLKAGPFVRVVIPADDLRQVEIRETATEGRFGATHIHHDVWLLSSRAPLRLTFRLAEWDCLAFAAAIATAFGLETTRSIARRV